MNFISIRTQLTVDALDEMIQRNNREYGTRFALGHSFGKFELWDAPGQGNRRIECGSLQDIYQAFIRERFKESRRHRGRPDFTFRGTQKGILSEENPPRGIVITLERLTKILGIEPSPEDFQEQFSFSETYGYAVEEYRKEHLDATDEEVEAYGQKAEEEEQDEQWKKYVNAIESVAESAFNDCRLTVDAIYKIDRGVRYVSGYRITPMRDWADAANQIRDVINGIGMFEFNTLRDFLDSGPYTMREAVERHLEYVGKRWDVYGDTSPQRQFERAMR